MVKADIVYDIERDIEIERERDLMGYRRAAAATAAGIEELPEDVVRVVLSHLPSPWVVQARLVCKQWQRILCCTHFALQWAVASHSSSNPSQSLFLLLPQHHISATLSALHLPILLCLPLPGLPAPLSSPPLASSPALGLLLSSSSSSSLSLFHPLSRLSLPLPPPRLIHSPLSAAVSDDPSPFHILALGVPASNPPPPSDTTSHVVAEIYSSATSAWFPLPCLPTLRNTTCIPRSTASIVWWKEAFCMLWGNHILTCKTRGGNMHAAAAASMRGQEEMSTGWGSIELPREPRIWDARFLTLHVIKGRLFVEGNFQEQGDFQRRYPLRIGVIEFDATKQEWKATGLMPDALSRRLCKQQHPAHCFYTAYSDALSGHIYFTPFIDQASSCASMVDTGIEVVLFDVDSACWCSISIPTSAALFSCPSFKGVTFHASG